MEQRPLLVWFTNHHEQSLQYLKFGLMQLARQGDIRLQERPVTRAEGWLPADLRQRSYRRIVLVGLEWKGQRRLIAVDGEDSPFQLSDLIERVDRYYTCTYCPYLYRERQFRFALPWQSEAEVKPYMQRFEELVRRYGQLFGKVRPWAPIGPDLEWSPPHTSWTNRKITNMRHKLQLHWFGTVDWEPQFTRFKSRWSYIQGMRTLKPCLDVALLDSLWGWPRHRIALHQQLSTLSGLGYDIRACLRYRKPEAYELGDGPAPDPKKFPVQIGEAIIGNYEELLATSRLGIFATGFHYGWRNIVTLAWAVGLQTLQDPFTYTFLFDAASFHRNLGPMGWDGLAQALDQVRQEEDAMRQKRWLLFEQVASPHRIATMVIEQLTAELF